MITDKELAKIHVRRIIFHDVPYNRKGGTSEPKLANAETRIDAERAAMLWIAELPPHLNINRIELMPVSQSFAGFQVAREGS